MKCYKCSTNEAEIEYPNGKLCKNCFLDIIYKRIEKDIKQQPFKKGEKVLVFGQLTHSILSKINKIDIDVIERNHEYTKSMDISQFNKVVIPWTADDEAEAFYESITSPEPTFEENLKIVKLFRSLSDEEVLQTAKILCIEHPQKNRNPDIERIRKKYQSSMFGLAKSSEEIKKALQ